MNTIIGLLAGILAGLTSLAATAAAIYVAVKVIKGLLKSTLTPEKLIEAFAVAAFAVFLLGATPNIMATAYDYGQSVVIDDEVTP